MFWRHLAFCGLLTLLGSVFASGCATPWGEGQRTGLYGLVDLERDCRWGVDDACFELGRLYESGRGGPVDLFTARKLYAHACADAHPASCWRMAELALRGLGGDVDRAAAHRGFLVGCTGSVDHACTHLGDAFGESSPLPPLDVPKHERACADGARSACLLLTAYFFATDDPRVHATAERACDAGSSWACRKAYNAAVVGRGGPQDFDRALAIARRNCEQRLSAEHCYRLGHELIRPHRTPDYAQAARLFRSACDSGIGGGCHELGILYARGHHFDKDHFAAFRWYERGCKKGSSGACIDVANRLFDGWGTEKNIARGQAMLEQLCAKQDEARACYLLASNLDSAGADDLDPRPMELYERSCHLGYASGCERVADSYRLGWHGVSPDADKSERFYAREVELRTAECRFNPEDCARLATLRHKGRGGRRDSSRALALAKRACTDGALDACELAGAILLHDETVARDRTAARTWLRRGCDAGGGGACRRLGVILEFEASLQAAERGCELGDETACSNLPHCIYEVRDPTRYAEVAGIAEHACLDGEPHACAALANAHLAGRVPNASPELGRRWQSRACELDADRCARTERMLLRQDTPAAERSRMRETYAARCEDGKASACFYAAWRLPDGQARLRLAARGCALGSDLACVERVRALLNDDGGARDISRAMAELEVLCARGVKCVWLRNRLGRSPDPADRARARTLARQECGDAEPCLALAWVRLYSPVVEEQQIGFATFVGACHAGDARQCNRVATSLIAAGRFRTAIAAARRSVLVDPFQPDREALDTLTLALLLAGRAPEARRVLDAALARSPSDAVLQRRAKAFGPDAPEKSRTLDSRPAPPGDVVIPCGPPLGVTSPGLRRLLEDALPSEAESECTPVAPLGADPADG